MVNKIVKIIKRKGQKDQVEVDEDNAERTRDMAKQLRAERVKLSKGSFRLTPKMPKLI